MTKVAIIPFFNYGHGNNDLLWKFFIRHAKNWAQYVDKVYVIDSGCNLLTFEGLPSNIELVPKPPQSHWQNMNEAIRATDAELLLLLDSDMIIYNPEVIKENFKLLEKIPTVKVISIFDSSGGVSLGKRFPIMAENEFRAERRRFTPYLCFLKKSSLPPNFDFTPIGGELWMDSMGKITEQILQREGTSGVHELQDDRSTISLEHNGRITSVQWLDTPPKKWALEENPNLGYYHIRNFGGGLKILKEGSYSLVPGREARRLLAWVIVLMEKTNYQGEINVESNPLFRGYYDKFKEYHFWLKNI